MAHDVQHVAVRCANKEAAHSPRFVLQRVHDLVAAPLRFFVSRVDVGDLYRHGGVCRCGSVVGDDLEADSRLRRCVSRDPSHVELLDAQAEILGVEHPRLLEVLHMQVSDDLDYTQRILALTAAIWHNDNIGRAIKRSLTAYDH